MKTIDDKNFIEKIWLQKCGDNLYIIKKSNKKQGKIALFKCYFKRFPNNYLYCQKSNIIEGNVVNYLKDVGEILHLKNGENFKITYFFRRKKRSWYKGYFLNPYYKCICRKDQLLEGKISNPGKENYFYSKIWPQNCGDYLKILDKLKNNRFLVYSIKYKNKFIARKDLIQEGHVFNTIIEEREIGKIYPQNSQDSIRILKKNICFRKRYIFMGRRIFKISLCYKKNFTTYKRRKNL